MKKTVLVTGATGYIGGRLVDYLNKSKKWNPLALSRKAVDSQELEWRIADFNTLETLKNACKGVYSIVHLASLNEIDSQKDPIAATLVNTIGTQKLLRASIECGVQRFIYFSTAHIYGSPLEGIITEQTLPRSVHPYASSHHAAEDYVIEAHDKGKIEAAVIRLSNGFGYPASKDVNRWTLLVNDVCRKVIETGIITLNSPGLQRRDFITLNDVCRAVEHLLEINKQTLGKAIFNVGGKNPSSILEMATLIADRYEFLFGSRPPIVKPESDIVVNSTLDYSIDTLLATGFELSGDISNEIDETLLRCKDWFGVK